MDLNKKNPEADASQPIPAQPDRSIQVLVLVYCGLIFAYTLAVIAGQVPDDRKITIPNLLLLLFAGASLIFLVKQVALMAGIAVARVLPISLDLSLGFSR